ncbi:MAG: hypothetical protein SFV22_01825, partial [Saprospiraceae bacterium]|nr:hypothetical protein [Saprospiraceae bacterium]
MRYRYLITGWFCGLTLCSFAQNTLEGYVFETNNRGYLNQVKISVFQLPDNRLLSETETDPGGHFSFSLPEGRYRIAAYKDIFFEKN